MGSNRTKHQLKLMERKRKSLIAYCREMQRQEKERIEAEKERVEAEKMRAQEDAIKAKNPLTSAVGKATLRQQEGKSFYPGCIL